MQTVGITALTETYNEIPCAVALGNFDGVHIGHTALFEKVKSTPYLPAVFTFAGTVDRFLTSEAERKDLIAKAQISLLFSAPFPLFQSLSPRDFVCFLKEKLAVKHVVCGYNFRFGKNAEGDTETLVALCQAFSLTADVVSEIKYADRTVSSSEIRRLLAEGNIEEANALLGHAFSVTGKVARGYSVGKTLGVPTLNLPLDPRAVPIRHGVYVSVTEIDGKRYPSITNVGTNPTFHRNTVTCETNLLDANGIFYGCNASVRLFAFLRPERKFESPEALRNAIAMDVAQAKAYHGLLGVGI